MSDSRGPPMPRKFAGNADAFPGSLLLGNASRLRCRLSICDPPFASNNDPASVRTAERDRRRGWCCEPKRFERIPNVQRTDLTGNRPWRSRSSLGRLTRLSRAACLYRIYFVDIQLYVAVTSLKFPVWLQDGKWPPEGKLSSSSISPRGFLFLLLQPARICGAQGGTLCVAHGSLLHSKRCGSAFVRRDRVRRRGRGATNSTFLWPPRRHPA